MTDFPKLAETEPPPREAFNSWLNSAGAVSCTNEFDEMEPVKISDEDYEYFMEMWKRSGSKTLGDLTEFYVKDEKSRTRKETRSHFPGGKGSQCKGTAGTTTTTRILNLVLLTARPSDSDRSGCIWWISLLVQG